MGTCPTSKSTKDKRLFSCPNCLVLALYAYLYFAGNSTGDTPEYAMRQPSGLDTRMCSRTSSIRSPPTGDAGDVKNGGYYPS